MTKRGRRHKCSISNHVASSNVPSTLFICSSSRLESETWRYHGRLYGCRFLLLTSTPIVLRSSYVPLPYCSLRLHHRCIVLPPLIVPRALLQISSRVRDWSRAMPSWAASHYAIDVVFCLSFPSWSRSVCLSLFLRSSSRRLGRDAVSLRLSRSFSISLSGMHIVACVPLVPPQLL